MFLSAGQTSDYIGARALLSSIPSAGALLADRGYDADWFRNALIEMGISPCIPFRTGRKVSIPHDTELYRLRHRIENMFARLKDWRRIATRYDRCPILFLSACALAATVVYWLCVLTLSRDDGMSAGTLPERHRLVRPRPRQYSSGRDAVTRAGMVREGRITETFGFRRRCEPPKVRRIGRSQRLCCTKPVRDSSGESSVVAGLHEQTETHDLEDQDLAILQ